MSHPLRRHSSTIQILVATTNSTAPISSSAHGPYKVGSYGDMCDVGDPKLVGTVNLKIPCHIVVDRAVVITDPCRFLCDPSRQDYPAATVADFLTATPSAGRIASRVDLNEAIRAFVVTLNNETSQFCPSFAGFDHMEMVEVE